MFFAQVASQSSLDRADQMVTWEEEQCLPGMLAPKEVRHVFVSLVYA